LPVVFASGGQLYVTEVFPTEVELMDVVSHVEVSQVGLESLNVLALAVT
jgi:hypothetical protein